MDLPASLIYWMHRVSQKLFYEHPVCPSTRQGMHLAIALELDAASDFEFVLILLSGFPIAMSIPGLLDAIGLFADEELVGT